ncbi:MAG TPA: translation initiation factor IF-3 [Candidatus Hypogeohydataceae bacterium YC38]|nr:translation initiation factor IF-3 [Candidatus Brocadiales bacterium]
MSITQELRINERIFAKQVRLIGEEGEQLGVVSRQEALEKARELGTDLVEVAPQADPPVCRLMSYGKYKYRQKKKTQQKRHVSQLKELRLRPKTDVHDLQTKIRQARKFLERKDKVLVNMMFRGRERAHTEIGKEILLKFAQELEDIAKIEKDVRLDGRRMGMILAPKS